MQVFGEANVVTLQRTADKVIQNFHRERSSIQDEKQSIIDTAAELIKEDIKSVIQSTNYYPSSNDMSAEESLSFVPSSLQIFLEKLFVG